MVEYPAPESTGLGTQPWEIYSPFVPLVFWDPGQGQWGQGGRAVCITHTLLQRGTELGQSLLGDSPLYHSCLLLDMEAGHPGLFLALPHFKM